MLRDIPKSAAEEIMPLAASHFFQNMPRVNVPWLFDGTERYQSICTVKKKRYSCCSHVTLPIAINNNNGHAMCLRTSDMHGNHVLPDSWTLLICEFRPDYIEDGVVIVVSFFTSSHHGFFSSDCWLLVNRRLAIHYHETHNGRACLQGPWGIIVWIQS